MKLKTKHIAPYLPYGLYCINNINKKIEMTLADAWYHLNKGCKPILRPLTDLSKEVQYKNELIIPKVKLIGDYKLCIDVKTNGDIEIWGTNPKLAGDDISLTLNDYMFLFELHFDVFGLIDKGLAININKL